MTTVVDTSIASNNHGVQTPSEFYVSKDIKPKRRRRTKAAVLSIRDHIKDVLEQNNPQTVRQVFYALTVRGVIAKAEIEYKRTVVRLLAEMREVGEIPFEWIADNTRWQRKPTTFIGIEACLNSTAKFYRRDLWAAMPVYVEVWCEKDALAGVIMEETEVYDVPLMVAKGYASISFLHSAAEAIEATGKPAHIYHFGDLDPSGVDAARDIEAKLGRYAPGAEIHFERPAVTRPNRPDNTRAAVARTQPVKKPTRRWRAPVRRLLSPSISGSVRELNSISPKTAFVKLPVITAVEGATGRAKRNRAY